MVPSAATPQTPTWYEAAELWAPDRDERDLFGRAVAVSGQTLVATAPQHRDVVDDSGAAYVFERDLLTGEWVLTAQLTAPDQERDDRMGDSAAIDGDRIAIGAENVDTTAKDAGAIYVWEREAPGEPWEIAAKLVVEGGARFAGLGSAVALDGERLAAGAQKADVQPRSGAVYLFERDAGAGRWDLVAEVTPPDGIPDQRFGSSLALADDLLVVGAWGDLDRGALVGAAYVFERDPASGSWESTAKLVIPDGEAGDRFGTSTAIGGTTLFVGAPDRDLDGQLSVGSVHVFDRDPVSGRWVETQELLPPDPIWGGDFGSAIAAEDDRLVVGSAGDRDLAYRTGSAYVFERDRTGAEWKLAAQLLAPDARPNDQSGSSVSISGEVIALGAELSDVPLDREGAVSVFETTTADPRIVFEGSCPSRGTLRVEGLTPRGFAALYRAASLGDSRPQPRCREARLELLDPIGVAWLQADEIGGVARTQVLDPAACGTYFQMIDIASCAVSSVALVE